MLSLTDKSSGARVLVNPSQVSCVLPADGGAYIVFMVPIPNIGSAAPGHQTNVLVVQETLNDVHTQIKNA